MNKPITLCDRCEKAARCLLNYDGIPCRKIRTVEPTNADRIRAMSDEEMAMLFGVWVADCDNNDVPCREQCEKQPSCGSAWLAWLKSPTEVDDGA